MARVMSLPSSHPICERTQSWRVSGSSRRMATFRKWKWSRAIARIRCNTSSRSNVESTAWPASYRTAISGIPEDSIFETRENEVPKVPGLPRERLVRESTPSSDGADEPVDREAKAEVDQHAQVEPRGTVPRDHGQRWDQR